MIFCNRDIEEFHCQECGKKLKENLVLAFPHQQYGLYMCSNECFTSFKKMGRLDYWIRLIGRSKNSGGRNDFLQR